MYSTLDHPKEEPLLVIRQWQVEACDGNVTAAALMSFFDYWHGIKTEAAKQNKKANEIAKSYGDLGNQSEDVLQWHTEQELVDGIMGISKRETVKKGLDLLQAKGFIKVLRNPNPRYKYDRTKYFYLCSDVINEWLATRKLDKPSSKNRGQSAENRAPITETSSKTSSKTSLIKPHIHRDDESEGLNNLELEVNSTKEEEAGQQKDDFADPSQPVAKKKVPHVANKSPSDDQSSATFENPELLKLVEYVDELPLNSDGSRRYPWNKPGRGRHCRKFAEWLFLNHLYKCSFYNDGKPFKSHLLKAFSFLDKAAVEWVREEEAIDYWNRYVKSRRPSLSDPLPDSPLQAFLTRGGDKLSNRIRKQLYPGTA
jgi:hypothetical protein